MCGKIKSLVLVASFLLPAGTTFARRKDQPSIHGRVTLSDGSLPQLLVTIERVCSGAIQSTVFADSQGRFTLNGSGANGCQVRAYLPGYRSQSVPEAAEVGALILRPRGKADPAARADRNKDVIKNKSVWAGYERGLDDAARAKWKDADDEFHDVTAAVGWFASAWLCLGMVQEKEGDTAAARKSYDQAIKAEDSFLLPYVYAAAIEITRGDWQEALDHSNKLIEADSQAFPGAWLANAWANLNLHHMDLAEKSDGQGIKLDEPEHRFPDLEYLLGLISLDKRDSAGAREHFKKYLALAPNGSHAAAARAEAVEH